MRKLFSIALFLLVCSTQTFAQEYKPTPRFWTVWAGSKAVFYLGAAHDYRTSTKFDGVRIIEGNRFYQNPDLTFNGSRYAWSTLAMDAGLDGIAFVVSRLRFVPRWMKAEFAWGSIICRMSLGVRRAYDGRRNNRLLKEVGIQ